MKFVIRKKRRKQKREYSSEDSENEELKRKKKKKVKKEDSDVEEEPVKSRKTLKNGVGNGKSKEITLVDLEEELNLEELMKQKVIFLNYFRRPDSSCSCYVIVSGYFGYCNYS